MYRQFNQIVMRMQVVVVFVQPLNVNESNFPIKISISI
jgi:hypothetical protein